MPRRHFTKQQYTKRNLLPSLKSIYVEVRLRELDSTMDHGKRVRLARDEYEQLFCNADPIVRKQLESDFQQMHIGIGIPFASVADIAQGAAATAGSALWNLIGTDQVIPLQSSLFGMITDVAVRVFGGSGMSARKRKELAEAAAGAAGAAAEEVVAATAAAAATVASEATKGVPLVNLNTQNILQMSLLHDKDRFTEYVADSSKMAATSFDSYAANQTSAAMPNATSGIPTQAAEATSNRGLLGTIFDTSSTIVSIISTAIYAYEAYQQTVNAWDSMKKTGIRARVNDAIYTSVALASLARTGLLQYAIGNYANFLDPLQTGAAGVAVQAGFIAGAWVIGAYLRYRTSRQIGSALPIVGIPLGGGIADGGRRSLFNWDSDLPKFDFSTSGGLGSLINIQIHFAPKVQLNLDAQISAFNKQITEDPLRDDETLSTKEITPQGRTLHREQRALAHCIDELSAEQRTEDGQHYYNIKIIRALLKACVNYSMLQQNEQELTKSSNFGHSMLQSMTARVFRAYRRSGSMYSRARINANIRALEATKESLSKQDRVFEKKSLDAGYWTPVYARNASKYFGVLLQPAYKDENGVEVRALDERIAELREVQVMMFDQLEKAEPYNLIKVTNEKNEAEEYLFFFDAAQKAFANIRDVNDHLGGLSWYQRIFSDEQRKQLSEPMLEIVETLRKDCLHAYEEFLQQWQTVVMQQHDNVIHMHIKKLITQMHATFEQVKGIDNEQEAFLNRLATLLQGSVFDQAVRLAVLSPFEGDKSDDEKVVTPIDPVAPNADDDDDIDEDDETVTPKEEAAAAASAPQIDVDAPKQLLRDNFTSVDAFLKSVYEHQDDNGDRLRKLLVGTVVAVRDPASDYITNPQQQQQQNQQQVVEYGEDQQHTLSLDNFIAQVYDMLSKQDASGFWEKLQNLKWQNDEKGIPVFYDSENGNTAFFRGYFDAAERYVFATAGSAHHMILQQHFSALVRLRAFHQLLEGLVIFSRDPDSSIQSRTSDNGDDPLTKDLQLLKSIAMRSHVLRSAAIPVAMTVPSVDFISLQKTNGPRALTYSADYALHTATAYTFLKCGFDRVLDRLVNDTSITEKFSDKVPVAVANLITQLYLELPTLSQGYAAYRNIINEKIHSEMIADLDDDNVINGSAGSFELNGEGSDRVNEVLAAFERIKERLSESNQYQDFEIEYLLHLESIGGRLADEAKHTVESWSTLFSDEKDQDRFAITWGSWNLLSEYFLAFDEDALVNSYNPSNTQVLLQLLSSEDVCALLQDVFDEDTDSDEFKVALTAYSEKMQRLKVHLDAYISCGHINSEVKDLIIGSVGAEQEWDELYNEPGTEQGFKSFMLLLVFYRYAKEQVQKQRSLRNKSGYALQQRLADRSLQVKSEESLAIAWNVKQLQHESATAASVVPFQHQQQEQFITVNMFTSTQTRNSRPYQHLVAFVPSEENILLENNVDVVAPQPPVFLPPQVEPLASSDNAGGDLVFESETAKKRELEEQENQLAELRFRIAKANEALPRLNPDHESREIQETQNLLRHLEAASRSVEKKINRLSRGRVDANEIYRRIKEQNLLREEEEARAAKDQKQFAQFELSLGADKRTDEQVRRAYAESRKQASSTGSSAPETGGIPQATPKPAASAPPLPPPADAAAASAFTFQFDVEPAESATDAASQKKSKRSGMSSSRAPSAFGAPKPPVSADTVPPKLTVEEQKKRNDLAEYKKAVQKMKQQAGTSGSSAAAAAPFAAPAPVVQPQLLPQPPPAAAAAVVVPPQVPIVQPAATADQARLDWQAQKEAIRRMKASNPNLNFYKGGIL